MAEVRKRMASCSTRQGVGFAKLRMQRCSRDHQGQGDAEPAEELVSLTLPGHEEPVDDAVQGIDCEQERTPGIGLVALR